jgi:hypothetical protein
MDQRHRSQAKLKGKGFQENKWLKEDYLPNTVFKNNELAALYYQLMVDEKKKGKESQYWKEEKRNKSAGKTIDSGLLGELLDEYLTANPGIRKISEFKRGINKILNNIEKDDTF